MFGDILKSHRRAIDLTQQQLADKLNIDRTSISKYENNKQIPEIDVLRKIADFFNITVSTLLGEENTPIQTQEELKDHKKFMSNLEVQFMGASERDRDKIYKKISELYWKYKDEE